MKRGQYESLSLSEARYAICALAGEGRPRAIWIISDCEWRG
jgi:hypothetical protein